MTELKENLIKLLLDNARYTDNQLAKMVNENEATVAAAISELEKEGVIVKYSAIINTEALQERRVEALIEVKVAPKELKGFDSYAEQIYTFSEVKSLYLMSGGFDLAVFVEGKDITDIARFISEKLSVIDGIISVQTHFILKKYKIEGQVTRPNEDCQRVVVQA